MLLHQIYIREQRSAVNARSIAIGAHAYHSSYNNNQCRFCAFNGLDDTRAYRDRLMTSALCFVMTQMYGCYTKELGDYVKGTQNVPAAPVMHGNNACNEEFSRYGGKISSTLEVVWRHSFAKLSEDWVFLTLLGFVMAVLSFFMDYGIDFTNEGKSYTVLAIFTDIRIAYLCTRVRWPRRNVSAVVPREIKFESEFFFFFLYL